MWVWNHPLRLKKPLKRVGERGEGKFKEVTWDEALDDIAARVKKIVETDGERAVSMTSHNYTGLQKWFGVLWAPQTSSATLLPAIQLPLPDAAWFSARALTARVKSNPTTRAANNLLCVGRTLNCAMGVSAVVARAALKAPRSFSWIRECPKAL